MSHTDRHAGDLRPHTASQVSRAPVAARASAPRLWIQNSWQDLLLYIGTPLLIFPLVRIAQTRFSVEQIGLYVASFGAMGHHLPGLMRAYGDRELFQRFKVRFIVAPLFLLTVALLFSLGELHGLILIAILWATWHALMQVYGFLRIYDAKVQSFASLTARLDLLMCLAWFGGGVLFSSARMNQLLTDFYKSGGPLLPSGEIHNFQIAWGIFSAIVTVAFLVNLLSRWAEGSPANPLKLLLMLTSFGFWWFTNLWVNNVILGAALFEIFHDVQYLAIVWMYNRKRVENNRAVGTFTRFLFRRSGVMIGLYVGLVFAYGYIGLLPEFIDEGILDRFLGALYVTSGMLHFYYDGFIWKVRERSTREGLGLRGGEVSGEPSGLIPGWMTHGAKWTLFVVPVGLLGFTQLRGVQPLADQLRNIVEIVPDSWRVQHQFGVELGQQGNLDQAVDHLRRAVRINPENADIHRHLGHALARQNYDAEAARHLSEAVRINPDLADAHVDLGVVLRRQGKHEDAAEHFRRALRIDPDHAKAHNNLGSEFVRRGNVAKAREHFERALRIDPDYAEAHNNLGLLFLGQGQLKESAQYFKRALDINPRYAEAHMNLGVVFAKEGAVRTANTQYREALKHNPNLLSAFNSLAWNLATSSEEDVRNGDEAVRWAERAARLTQFNDVGILKTLAAAYAESGRFDDAVSTAERAVELSQSQQRAQMAEDLESHLKRYRDRRPVRER